MAAYCNVMILTVNQETGDKAELEKFAPMAGAVYGCRCLLLMTWQRRGKGGRSDRLKGDANDNRCSLGVNVWRRVTGRYLHR